jgi:outer membrane protein assembly factor BamD
MIQHMFGPLCGSLREFRTRCDPHSGPRAREARQRDTGEPAKGLCADTKGQRPLAVSSLQHARRGFLALAAFLVALGISACGGNRSTVPPNTAAPDQFLYERGLESMKNEEWLNAREYFRQVVDGYPQSPVRPDSKLGVGDSFLGDGSTESLVLAAQEFREFLQFYPTNPRADYAQYKLAMSHYEQMRAPERDQTETREALKEFDIFFQRHPNSALLPEVKQKWRDARDRLSEASYRVGLHYYRVRWYPGAIDRFREVLKEDPGFSGRDRIYFYLAESLSRTDKTAEAIPYFERLLAEFPESEHRADTMARLETLKTQ